MNLLKVVMILFVVLWLFWLFSRIMWVEVMFSVSCSMVVISSMIGKMVKFSGCFM